MRKPRTKQILLFIGLIGLLIAAAVIIPCMVRGPQPSANAPAATQPL